MRKADKNVVGGGLRTSYQDILAPLCDLMPADIKQEGDTRENFERLFQDIDVDGSKSISKEEWVAYFTHHLSFEFSIRSGWYAADVHTTVEPRISIQDFKGVPLEPGTTYHVCVRCLQGGRVSEFTAEAEATTGGEAHSAMHATITTAAEKLQQLDTPESRQRAQDAVDVLGNALEAAEGALSSDEAGVALQALEYAPVPYAGTLSKGLQKVRAASKLNRKHQITDQVSSALDKYQQQQAIHDEIGELAGLPEAERRRQLEAFTAEERQVLISQLPPDTREEWGLGSVPGAASETVDRLPTWYYRAATAMATLSLLGALLVLAVLLSYLPTRSFSAVAGRESLGFICRVLVLLAVPCVPALHHTVGVFIDQQLTKLETQAQETMENSIDMVPFVPDDVKAVIKRHCVPDVGTHLEALIRKQDQAFWAKRQATTSDAEGSINDEESGTDSEARNDPSAQAKKEI